MLSPHIFKLFVITIVYMYYDDLGGNYMLEFMDHL